MLAEEALPTADRNAKAVKHDDAPVPVHLWNNRISVRQGTAETVKTRVLDYVRDRLLGKMCVHLRKEMILFLRARHGAPTWNKTTKQLEGGWLSSPRAKQKGSK